MTFEPMRAAYALIDARIKGHRLDRLPEEFAANFGGRRVRNTGRSREDIGLCGRVEGWVGNGQL